MKTASSLRSRFLQSWSLLPLSIAMGVIALAIGCNHTTAPKPAGPAEPEILSLSPQNATLGVANVIQLSASIIGWKTDSTVSWSFTCNTSGVTDSGSLKIIGKTAVYTAPAEIPVSPVIVLIKTRSNDDTNEMEVCTITVKGTPAGPAKAKVYVSPSEVTIAAGATQQFQAIVTGISDTNVRWQLLSGPGTLSSAGFYTSPGTVSVGSVSVQIEAVLMEDTTVRGEAQITVQTAPLCFRTQVWPIMLSHCTVGGCHNAIDHTHGLDFTSYAGVMATVVPGDTTNSELHQRLNHFATSPDSQVRAINNWIESGAPYSLCQPDMAECDTADIRYSTFIEPLIATNCLGCHSQRFTSECQGIDLSTYRVVDSLVQNGQLMSVLRVDRGFPQMPQWGPPLDQCVVNKFQAWVNRGAPNN